MNSNLCRDTFLVICHSGLRIMPNLIPVLLILTATLSKADWQYTKWGMRREDVIKVAKGATIPDADGKDYSSDIEESLLAAPYKAGQFEFIAHFGFDKKTGGLRRVTLELKPPGECDLLWRELLAKYGRPQAEHKILDIMESVTWRDEKANNGVGIMKMKTNDTCQLHYWELKGPSNKGL